ncbi:hypothetical protein DL763_003581 [Monosporascus cannonballus]|nr:hypothetical protein DL763_003581 [Monosporascus cannonballus]
MSQITTTSSQCLRSFEQLCSSLGNAKPDCLELMPLEAIKNEYGRLRVWCGNLGALARGHGSIDFRLRESAVMQTNVLKLLGQLLSSLSESIAVVSGSRLPFEQQPCPADLSEPETETSDDSDDDNGMQQPRRELEIRLASIQDTLSHLYRLSFKIRNPNLKPQSLKATLYQEIDQDRGVDLFERFAAFDKAHVNELVSTLRSRNADAREPDYLVSRLAWAITVRRKQSKYWDNHYKKFAAQDAISHVAVPESEHLDIVSNAKINLQPENIPSQVHKTLLSATEATKYDVALDDKTQRGTIVSYASTALDLDGRGVDLPAPPLEADKGKEFLCPYYSIGPGVRSISAFADMLGALDQESLTREGLSLPPVVFDDEPWSEDTSPQILDSDLDSKFVAPATPEDEESWDDFFQAVKQSHIPEPDKDPLLREWRSRNPPKPSFDAMESVQDVPVSQSAEARRDYSDEELLELLVRRIHDRFKKKMKVEGGIDGLYSRILVQIQIAPSEDRCVILMGYPEQMEELFQNSNPGLARRFSLEETFHFADFDNVQLGQILDLKLNKEELSATSEAKRVAIEILSRARDRPNFGNGSAIEDLLSRAKAAYQERVSMTTVSERTEGYVLEVRDFDANYDGASHASENGKSMFKDLVGLEDIIAQFEGYQRVAAGMRLHGTDPRPYIPFTFVFKGPPGTRKTITARAVAQIYYDMGFLSAPQVFECSFPTLMAEYAAKMSGKVIRVLKLALGTLLIIHGPYSLGEGNSANEVIGELVDCVAKERFERKMIIILAGYEEDINELMRVNPSLRSRFATEVVFHRMRPEHCLQLLQQCVGKLGIQIEGVDRLDGARWTPVVRLFSKFKTTKSWANV